MQTKPAAAQNNTGDSVAVARTTSDTNHNAVHQIRIGIDISKPIINALQDGYKAYEFTVDYSVKKGLYAVLDGGFAAAGYNYPDLNYNTRSSFARIGINKSLLPQQSGSDFDIITIGLQYGLAFINRTAAAYTVTDSLFGSSTGIIPKANLNAHWAEINGGMRVELLRGFFAGWTVRGKFLLNGQALKTLPPSYIAGYGRGEKNAVFDFNLYLCYAIRWK